MKDTIIAYKVVWEEIQTIEDEDKRKEAIKIFQNIFCNT